MSNEHEHESTAELRDKADRYAVLAERLRADRIAAMADEIRELARRRAHGELSVEDWAAQLAALGDGADFDAALKLASDRALASIRARQS